MKLNIFKSSLFLLAAVALGSCSEGKYWDEPSNPGSIYAFTKPAETISVPADQSFPSTVEVTVSRNSSVGEVTVPVTTEASSPLLTGPSSVTFADGSNTATYTISLADGLFAGVNYTYNITLDQPEGILTQVNPDNLKFALRISKVLVLDWHPAGTAAAFSSTWAPADDPVDIAVEVASNYPSENRLCRLIAPYKALDPDYTPDSADLQFFIDDEGNAAGMYATWQYMGQNDDEEGYYFFGCPANYGMSFTNEGNVYTMTGIIGTSATLTGSVAAGWYETITFTWDAPSK